MPVSEPHARRLRAALLLAALGLFGASIVFVVAEQALDRPVVAAAQVAAPALAQKPFDRLVPEQVLFDESEVPEAPVTDPSTEVLPQPPEGRTAPRPGPRLVFEAHADPQAFVGGKIRITFRLRNEGTAPITLPLFREARGSVSFSRR